MNVIPETSCAHQFDIYIFISTVFHGTDYRLGLI